MKRLLILFSLALIGALSFSQINSRRAAPLVLHDDEDDNIDHTLEGPNGETVYIGVNGGRYYFRNERKVYVRRVV